MRDLNKILLNKVGKTRMDLIHFVEAKGGKPRMVDSLTSHTNTRQFYADFFKIRLKDYNFLCDHLKEMQTKEYFFSSESDLVRDIIAQMQRNYEI